MKKIMRKFVSILVCLALATAFLPDVAIFVSATTNIKIGDYIRMGTYYGEPILWRCVDIDENGPLILSDKIICMKAFDAAGNVSSGSHGRAGNTALNSRLSTRQENGSNFWGDSNIRSWLNSKESSVEWLCGNMPAEAYVKNGYNAYNSEEGFLTNFDSCEINAIKTVKQKVFLDRYEYVDITGQYERICPGGAQTIEGLETYVRNYDLFYSTTTTDKMFLLDEKQVYNIYLNRNILGAYYHKGKLTVGCAENSQSSSELSTSQYYGYWLRSAAEDSTHSAGTAVRKVNGSAQTSYEYNNGDYVTCSLHPNASGGIRPAFYIKSKCHFEDGDGTENNPYNKPYIENDIPVSSVSMMSPSTTIKDGDTYQVMAYCTPTDATDKKLTWSTDNPLVATVSTNGVVTAKGPGKATVTAKSNNGKKASCIVTVTKQNIIDYDDFKYSFDNSHNSFGYSDSYKIPKERYMQLGYAEAKAKAIVKDNPMWGGNCFGMSTSSILFYKNNIQEERYNSSIKTPKSFEEPKTNNTTDTKLRQMIELMQISQEVAIGGESYQNKAFSASAVAKEIDNGNPVLLSLLCARTSLMDFSIGGHAVVIYNYTKSGDSYIFDIYDCSNYIKSLSYKGPLDYTFTITNDKYLWYIRSYCNYDSIINMCAKIYNNNSNGAASLFSLRQESAYTYIFRPAETLTITNSSGQISAISDGEVSGDIADIKLIPSSYLAEEPTYTIILPTDTYTIVGSGDEVVTTSFADDYMSASVTARSSTPITISSDLGEISVDTVADDKYDITYTTWDNIFDEMTLSGTASDVVSATLNDADVTVTGVSTLTASASVSDSKVSVNLDNLADSNEITVRCEEDTEEASIQLLNADAELTKKTALPERLTVDMPAYDLESGTYTEGQVLNFTKDDDTIIYYTTDGSIPSADNGIIYSLPIDINKSMTVKAISTKYGYSDSDVLELNYILPEVDAPFADVASGEYDKVITVELSTGSYDDEIYYTLDGSNPLENGILYTVPLNISEDTYLQAYTLRDGCISEISEYEYTITPEYPFHISNSLTNQNGESITADNISDITKVRLTVSKLQEGEHTGIFFVEFYDAEENLLSTKSTEAIISEDTDVVEVDITDDVSTACTVKAFACEDLSGTQLMCEEYKETFRDVAEENLAAAEETKETVSALADGSAETSALIQEINAEIDIMLEDGAISADEAAKINTLKKQAKMSCGVLNLRFQIAAGTTDESEKSDMRFISTVDSPNYRETGFYITINGTKKRIATRNVYSSLVGKDGSAVTTYAPEDIFSESKWFSTYSIWNIPNSAFDSPITVQAFVINPDGTETLGVEKTRTVRNFIRK